jgi:hypothetical protein
MARTGRDAAALVHPHPADLQGLGEPADLRRTELRRQRARNRCSRLHDPVLLGGVLSAGSGCPRAGRLALLMPLKEQDGLDPALPLIPENNRSY